MNLKQALAARLDARYVRRNEHTKLRREVRALKAQLSELQDACSNLRSRVDQLSGDVMVTSKSLDQLRPKANEGHRLALECARSVEALMEAEVTHRQSIDSLTGDGR